MTTCDNHRRKSLSAQESISAYCRAYYEAALGLDHHHNDLVGQSCWLPDEWDTAAGLLAIRGEARS
jgi:hypothetical protein